MKFLMAFGTPAGTMIDESLTLFKTEGLAASGPFVNQPAGSVEVGHRWEGAPSGEDEGGGYTVPGTPYIYPLSWTRGGETYFGRMTLTVLLDVGDTGFPVKLDLVHYAYNPTPGEGIVAGEHVDHGGGNVIPTPAAAPIGIALGALASIRRRR